MSALVKKVRIAEDVKRYALRITLATHADSPEVVERVRRFVNYGASPRAAQSMILAAKVKALADRRYNVSYKDLHDVALPALRHRVLLNFEAEVAKVGSDDIIRDVLTQIKPT
jgi:MoxR-like ATPase